MSKIVVLGAGMVGRAIAIDLSKVHQVTSVDIIKDSLDLLPRSYQIATLQGDVQDEAFIRKAIKDADLVISAVPGFLGYQTIVRVIESGKNLVDISFLPEDVMPLDRLAKKMNVTAVMDCGVAPGMPNIIAGYHNDRMKIHSFEYMVGGLPKIRTFPFEYKAPFSPCDVIEEYTRPARLLENGVIVTKPAMSDPELLNFNQVGTLEAFNTDGLRSLLYTLGNIPNMKEKTLRYPGHIRLIQALQATGFFDTKPIEIQGHLVSPFDYTSKILFKSWRLVNEEPEFTVMRIILKGEEDGKLKTYTYDLYDEFDPVEKLSSMARTTGFTATAVAGLILNGQFSEKGLFPPEFVGKDGRNFKSILAYLKQRNVNYIKQEV